MTRRNSAAILRRRLHRSGLFAAMGVMGTFITLLGCSDEGTSDDGAGLGGTSGTTTAGTSGAAASAGTGGAGTSGGGAGGAAAGTAGSGGTAGSNGGTGTAGLAGAAGNAGTAGAAAAGGDTGGAGAGGMAGGGMAGGGMAGGGMGGAGTSGSAGTGGAAGNAGGGADDFDPRPEDFTCIADWQQVLGFRITNALGQTAEAIAVAEGTGGDVYPVGTILQHLPTEAMVKRRAGFSAETKDWEFFLLELSPEGETTIAARGTTEIETSMGQTCVSCHSLAPDEFDFVCNTWGDQGADDCGFDFMQSFLDQQLATDTRCP